MEKDNANTSDTTIRVVVIGPESTGKSTLSEALAKYYNTLWVPEFARHYIDKLDRPYKEDDLVHIARGQIHWENQKSEAVDNLLICDTDLIVIKVWSEHKYGNCHPEILNIIENRNYDLYLLTDVDLPWEEDPQRENPHLREHFMDIFKAEIKSSGTPYTLISGDYSQRLRTAIQAVNTLLNK